jgi:hypothetical protein
MLTAGPDGVLYAIASRTSSAPCQRILRYDPSTRQSETSCPLLGIRTSATGIAIAGGALWVATGELRHPNGSHSLLELNGRTLVPERALRFAAPPTALASTPAGLWVAAGRHLVLIDPSTATVQRTETFLGHVRALVASPDGTRLYVATDAPVHQDHQPLLELDAWTGDVVASAWEGYADLNGVGSLSASSAGVWALYATGMMSGLTLHRSSDLAPLRQGPAGSNGRQASVAGPVLFSGDVDGYTCADGNTGDVTGYIGIRDDPAGISHVVMTSAGFFVGSNGGIYRLLPPPACLAP